MQCDLGSKYKLLCSSKLVHEGAGSRSTSMDRAEGLQGKSLNRAQDESKDFQLQAEARKRPLRKSVPGKQDEPLQRGKVTGTEYGKRRKLNSVPVLNHLTQR